MGKQINYWMEYETFQNLASIVVENGGVIVPWNNPQIQITNPTNIYTDIFSYYFYFPQIGDLILKTYGNPGNEFFRVNEYKSAIIQCGFSNVNKRSKYIIRNRIYVPTGYWSDDEKWIPRGEEITKMYNKLARVIKKLCPYTELIDTYFSTEDKTYGQMIEHKHKEYISSCCLKFHEEGFKLGQ